MRINYDSNLRPRVSTTKPFDTCPRGTVGLNRDVADQFVHLLLSHFYDYDDASLLVIFLNQCPYSPTTISFS